MYLMMMFMTIFLMISSLFLIINLILMKLNHKMREKNSSFECGFPTLSDSRLPFSIQFFFITIIFLIFDVEMTLLFPLIKNLNLLNLSLWMMSSMMIFMLLMLGLFIEWMNNLLKWFN